MDIAPGNPSTVRFVRTALVEFDFTRRFFSTRQHGTHHYRACASGDSFGDVTGEANTTICDNRNTGAFQGFNCVSNGSDLRNTYASNDTSVQIEPGPIPTLTALQPASAKARAPAAVATLPPMICKSGYLARVSRSCKTPSRVTVGGVNQQNVNASGNQRVNTLFVTRTCANCSTNTQTALLVFTGVRFTFRFLN